jgi:hypothetical protein
MQTHVLVARRPPVALIRVYVRVIRRAMIHAPVGSVNPVNLCLLSFPVIVVVMILVVVVAQILLDVVASEASEVHRGDRIVSPLVVVGGRATVQYSILAAVRESEDDRRFLGYINKVSRSINQKEPKCLPKTNDMQINLLSGRIQQDLIVLE